MGKNIYINILIGILAGFLFTLSPGAILVLGIFVLTIFLVKAHTEKTSSDFLIKLLIAGFALRILLAVLNYFLGFYGVYGGSDTQPDAIIYNANAVYISKILSGFDYSGVFPKEQFLPEYLQRLCRMFECGLPPYGKYQFGFYVHALAVFYSWIGYSPVAAKILNSLAGCGSAILVYFLARMLTGSVRTAKISSFIAMFFPSQLYWSVTLLQDSIVNFIFLSYLFSLLAYLKDNKKFALGIAFISCFLLCLLKTKIVMLFVLCLVIVFLIKSFKAVWSWKFLPRAVLAIVIISLLVAAVYAGRPAISVSIQNKLAAILNAHKAYATSYSSTAAYRLYSDVVYSRSAYDVFSIFNWTIIYAAVKGIAYYFLSPFPWDMPFNHPGLLLFYPQVIFTFACIPFMLCGALASFRYNSVLTGALAIFLSVMLIPQAVTEGIIGNVVRHRDMFMPFIIIFAAYGFYILTLPREDAIKDEGRAA